MARRTRRLGGSSAPSSGDPRRARSHRRRGPGLLAARGGRPVLGMRRASGHPTLPAGMRDLRRGVGLARHPALRGQSADLVDRGQRPEREYVPPVLDLGTLGGRAIPQRGAVHLVTDGNRLWHSRLPVASGGIASADGDGGDAGPVAAPPRDAHPLAKMVPGSRLSGPGLAGAGRPVHGAEGRAGNQAGHRAVLGLAPASPPGAMERERPLPADQTVLATYRVATVRMLRAIRGAATTPLLPLAILGIGMAPSVPSRPRRSGSFLR